MRILVAMSGGVDSAVAALLLKEQGHEVVGMTMRVYDEPERTERRKSCCAPHDLQDARGVAHYLGIPYYAVDLRREFHDRVMRPFAEDYMQGRTPNPCVRCNSDLKFGVLLQRAKALGFDHVATGHYARRQWEPHTSRFQLRRARDENKDQSYFLFSMTPSQLEHTLFPLGDLTKAEVRALAREAGLPVADKPESQEICFVAGKRYTEVISQILPHAISAQTGGVIRDANGTTLGTHEGIFHFTVGQRKGLQVSHPTPLYVLGMRAEKQEVVVGPEAHLYRSALDVRETNWIAPPPDPSQPLDCEVAIRYRHRPARARLQVIEKATFRVEFGEPQRAVTPGQAAVFYRGEEVLGGGWIAT